MEYTKDLSIVISLYNEEESLHELVEWIEGVMQKEGYVYLGKSSKSFLRRTLASEAYASVATTANQQRCTMDSKPQKDAWS